jgi:steroid 5-alpha reductase family enzyme
MIIVPFVSFYYATPLSDAQLALLKNAAFIALGIALACFFISEISKNYSQTDKIWSIAPIIYAWYICAEAGWQPRLILMAVLVTLWGLRLSWNFNRRGGYSLKFWEGEEDYRWAILRKKPFLQSAWAWRLFNLFFISLYQNALIFLFTLPILAAYTQPATDLNWWDLVLAILFVSMLVYETIADNQQWKFQNKKYALLKANKKLEGDYAKGFLQKGLWAKSRHPNYFAEQSIWFIFYLFSVVATGEWINWSMIGVLLLFLLFYQSAQFSEGVSAEKYVAYKEYQQKVPLFFPKLF